MKAPKYSRKNVPSAIAPHDNPKLHAPLKYPARIPTNQSTKPQLKVRQSPDSVHMLLNDEIGRKWKNPNWTTVELLILELDPGRFNSFACLAAKGHNYVQCLHGFNGWHLEWRISNSSGYYVHYRASYPGGSEKSFELKKHDCINEGQHRDLLHLEDVIDAFRCFHHQGSGLPGFLTWREMAI